MRVIRKYVVIIRGNETRVDGSVGGGGGGGGRLSDLRDSN